MTLWTQSHRATSLGPAQDRDSTGFTLFFPPVNTRIQDLPSEDRPREKLARLGAAALTNAELLALFIGSGSKSRSAIGIGQDLINHFGSINALGAAGLDALLAAPGIGMARCCQLAAAFELGARAASEDLAATLLDNPEQIYQLFGPQMSWLGQEKLIIALVDVRLRHSGTVEISSGNLTETVAHPREILRPAVLRNSYGFVMLHNHPSGDTTPSSADTRLTKRLAEAADLMQIRFVDHVIIGRSGAGKPGYYSFREEGLLS